MRSDTNLAPVSTYQDVKAVLLAEIRNGRWSPGELIPGEADLAGQFGCARSTVNRALRELAEAGIVERRRKAGTRVAQSPARPVQFTIAIVRHEIEARGQAYRYALLKRNMVKAPRAVQARFGGSAKMLHIQCLHYADEVPYQLEERWINVVAVPAATQEPFTHISPNEWLVREVPFSEAEHVFCAINASKEHAELLDVAERDALFVVERRTWREDAALTWVRLIHRGTSHRMISKP